MYNKKQANITFRFLAAVIPLITLLGITLSLLLNTISLHLHRLPDGNVVVHSHLGSIPGSDQTDSKSTRHQHSNTDYLVLSQSNILFNDSPWKIIPQMEDQHPAVIHQYTDIPIKSVSIFAESARRAPPQMH